MTGDRLSPVSRRELIATFLGLPVLAGCAPKASPRLPPAGEIVGAGLALGHAVRDGRLKEAV
ncbi:MAG: hypothetical protein EHM42_05710, partial [Planctomycetaceae bacterium]